MATHRKERTAERLQEILARVVREELRDPRLGFTTITGVRVSPDLEHAVVYVSRIGTDPERREAIEALRRAGGYLRRALAREAGLRHTPFLRFEEDRSMERGARIEAILDDLHREGDSGDGGE
jgi:ribosome-binding factor A